MKKSTFRTDGGMIQYWVNVMDETAPTLVLLPGLTADHSLFDKQIEYFEGKYNVLVWDAPGHGESRPFELNFSLDDKARFLYEILLQESIAKPVLIGQSMGGYVSQAYMELFPEHAIGFISIDSAPLKRRYMTAAEIWLLYRMEPCYRAYPWRRLLKDGPNNCAVTEYGRNIMRRMMETYEKREFCKLAGHGYSILARAIDEDKKYEISCPCLLICGDTDKAGATKRYNKRWTAEEGFPIEWIKNAGHNSNTDRPEDVNRLIERFVKKL